MQISLEGKIGIWLALVGLAGAGAIMIAPEKLWIGWGLISLAALGSAALAFHHFGRRFAFIFVVFGVLWFDSWYYSNVLNAPVVQPAPITAPSPVSPPPASPASARSRLVSNYTKMVLVCDSPNAVGKASSLKEKKAELAKYIDLMGKVFGYAVKGNVAEDELSFSVEVPQATGGTIKQDILIKRSGDKLFVSVTNHMEENALSLIFAIASLYPIDPDEDVAKQMRAKVEELVKVEPGKCKFV
jgi:hypothetical protein